LNWILHYLPVASTLTVGEMSSNYFSLLPYFFKRQKDIQLKAWTRPYGSRSLWLPGRLGSRQRKVVKVLRLTHRPSLHLRR